MSIGWGRCERYGPFFFPSPTGDCPLDREEGSGSTCLWGELSFCYCHASTMASYSGFSLLLLACISYPNAIWRVFPSPSSPIWSLPWTSAIPCDTLASWLDSKPEVSYPPIWAFLYLESTFARIWTEIASDNTSFPFLLLGQTVALKKGGTGWGTCQKLKPVYSFLFGISQRKKCKLAWEIGKCSKRNSKSKTKAKSTILGHWSRSHGSRKVSGAIHICKTQEARRKGRRRRHPSVSTRAK